MQPIIRNLILIGFASGSCCSAAELEFDANITQQAAEARYCSFVGSSSDSGQLGFRFENDRYVMDSTESGGRPAVVSYRVFGNRQFKVVPWAYSLTVTTRDGGRTFYTAYRGVDRYSLNTYREWIGGSSIRFQGGDGQTLRGIGDRTIRRFDSPLLISRGSGTIEVDVSTTGAYDAQGGQVRGSYTIGITLTCLEAPLTQ